MLKIDGRKIHTSNQGGKRMKLLGIAGALIGNKTSIVVNEVLKRAKEAHPELETELLFLGDYQVELVDGRPLDQYNEDTQNVIRKIKEADLYVIGSPVYQASITGALKNLFDHLPYDVFDKKVVGLVMNGGTDRHYLVMETHLKSIVSFLKAYVPSNSVYVTVENFNQDNEIADEEIQARIKQLGTEIVSLHKKLNP